MKCCPLLNLTEYEEASLFFMSQTKRNEEVKEYAVRANRNSHSTQKTGRKEKA